MTNFILIPHDSLDEIYSGQERSDVRNVVGAAYEEFYKTSLSKVPTDDIVGRDFHVFYDDDLFCKGVEIFSPNNVSIAGMNLLSTPFFDLKKQIEKLGCSIEMNDSGLDCEDFGISLYCPDYKISNDVLVESVYVRFSSPKQTKGVRSL